MVKKKETGLADRMKGYEDCYRLYLPKRLPVIVRVDMRSGHTFTRGMDKPYDDVFSACMEEVLLTLCKEFSLCKFGYSQSDEASVVAYSTTINTEPWFMNNFQKIVSLCASIASVAFNSKFQELSGSKKTAVFDARAFVLPEHEVLNYFIQRQQDCVRNSVESLAQAHFSQKELFCLSGSELQEKLFTERGVNWNDVPTKYKRGFVCKTHEVEIKTDKGTASRRKWYVDEGPPVFTANRGYVESAVFGC